MSATQRVTLDDALRRVDRNLLALHAKLDALTTALEAIERECGELLRLRAALVRAGDDT